MSLSRLSRVASPLLGRAPLPLSLRRGYTTSTLNVVQDYKENVLATYSRPDIVFVRGKGSHVFDNTGKGYLDFASGIAVNALGHGDEGLAKVIAEQAATLIHASNLFHTEPAIRLAKMMVEKSSSFSSKVFFANSGTEANEGALKFGRLWGRHIDPTGNKIGIVSFENAFHGRTMGALAVTPSPKYQKPFAPLIPGVRHAKFNDLESAKKVIDDSVCAVIVEPIQGEGGIFAASSEFIHGLKALCEEKKCILIFDEIQCGLGRTGKLFAYENFGVLPDIVTMAKPLAGGIPIGAILLSNRVASLVKLGDHGTTFGGNPLACRAGEEVFKRVSDPKFLEDVVRRGELLRSHLNKALDGSPVVKEIRGYGLMQGIELIVDPQPVIDIARDELGLLLIKAGNNTIRLVPPLVITDEDIIAGVSMITQAIKKAEPSLLKASKENSGHH